MTCRDLCNTYLGLEAIDRTILLDLEVEINAKVYFRVANNYRETPQNVAPRSPDVVPLYFYGFSRTNTV